MFIINKNGFIFIETIIVISVLTVSLMSLYANYSKILTNTKELNTYDTTEYNYKTHFIKEKWKNGELEDINGDYVYYVENKCHTIETSFSDNGYADVCFFINITDYGSITIDEFLNQEDTNLGVENYKKFDAYIIDYLKTQDINATNDDLFIVKYKKEDKQNSGEYLTYISSLNYQEME